MKKRKHYVDTDKISKVELIEHKKKTYIKFVAPIDGTKKEVEVDEDTYGKLLQEGYYYE